MEFFLIYAISIVIGCLIGASKGRFLSGLVWSLIFGPLGVLVVLCLKNLNAERKEKEAQAMTQRQLAIQEAQLREIRDLKERSSAPKATVKLSASVALKNTIRLSRNGDDLGEVDIPSAKLAVRVAGGLEGFYFFDFSKSDWIALIQHPDFR